MATNLMKTAPESTGIIPTLSKKGPALKQRDGNLSQACFVTKKIQNSLNLASIIRQKSLKKELLAVKILG